MGLADFLSISKDFETQIILSLVAQGMKAVLVFALFFSFATRRGLVRIAPWKLGLTFSMYFMRSGTSFPLLSLSRGILVRTRVRLSSSIFLIRSALSAFWDLSRREACWVWRVLTFCLRLSSSSMTALVEAAVAIKSSLVDFASAPILSELVLTDLVATEVAFSVPTQNIYRDSGF